MPPSLRIRVFGRVSLERDGRPLTIAGSKRVALIVLLAVEGAHAPLRRDSVLALLWPDSDERRARNALRNALFHARNALGDDVLIASGETLSLSPERVWCDAVEFERAFLAGDWAAAASLYDGSFMHGFHVSDAPDFERWMSLERLTLQRQSLEAALAASDDAERRGQLQLAEVWASRAFGMHPEDERSAQRLITVQLRTDNRSGALATYQEHESWLLGELGLPPSKQMRALHDLVRGGPVDTSSRRRAIEAHARALDVMRQAVIATDLEGKVVYWNAEAESLYGWKAAEALGRSIVDVTPAPQSRQQAEEIMAQLRSGVQWSGEFLVTRKDGSTFLAHVMDAPVLDSHGALVGIVGISSAVARSAVTD